MAAEAPPQRRALPNPFEDPPLLAGLMNAPVMSLVDAVALSNIKIDDSCIALACAHHRNMSPPDAYGLTPDEIGAFHLYTQDGPFFLELNRLLREMDRPRAAQCLPYLRLLVAGMHKLPKRSGRVFRAISVNLMDTLEPEKQGLRMVEAFPDGHEFLFWAVTTTYTSRQVIPLFAGRNGRRTIFTIKTHSAVVAAPYSAAGDKEKEWTLAPGARFRVVNGANSTFEQDDDAEIELEEVGTPFSLAQFLEAERPAPQNELMPPLLSGLIDAPVLPLAEAVRLTNIQIDESCVTKALDHHRMMSPPDAHGLTPDEIGAYHLYTQDCPFFFELNKLLRNENRPRVAACMPYLRLLVSGMNKLPRCSGQVFRGIKTNMMDTLSPEKRGLPLSETFPEGSELEWWGVTTTYTSASKVTEFAGIQGRRTSFSIKVQSAVNAAPYSADGDKDKEWTLAPGARVRVIGTADLGDVVQFHLEEIGTPFSLLQFEEASRLQAGSRSPGAMEPAFLIKSGSSPTLDEVASAAAGPQSPHAAASRVMYDLAFLHASPLTRLKSKAGSKLQEVHEVELLDVQSEIKGIVDEIGDERVGKRMKIRSSIATSANVAESLSGARCIHFSCHGETADAVIGSLSGRLLIEQDIRVNGNAKFGLASEILDSHLLELLRIKNRGQVGDIELVFVSACQSLEVGKKFVEFGVPHVIAVNHADKVADIAAGMFSTRLYRELFLGLSVQQAFDLASLELSACDHVDHNMKLVLAGRDSGVAQAAKFQLLGSGDHTQPLKFVKDLAAGENPMCKLMWDLADEKHARKVFVLHGETGVGKSTLLLESARYMASRGRRFVWIPCCPMRSPRAQGHADAFKVAADFQSVATLCNFIGRALGRPGVHGTADLLQLGFRVSVVFDGVDSLTDAQRLILFDRESGIIANIHNQVQCIITCRTNAHSNLLGVDQGAPIGAYCLHYLEPVCERIRVMNRFNAMVRHADEQIQEPDPHSAASKAEFDRVIDAFRGLPSRLCLAARFVSERVGAARQVPVLQSIIECLAQHDASVNANGDHHMQCSP